MQLTTHSRRYVVPYAFVLPIILLLLITNLYPMAYSVFLSLSVWPMEKFLADPTFSGLINFQRMFSDQRLWNSVAFMVFYVVATMVCELLLGLIVALILDRPLWGRSIFRSLVILPMAMAPLVVGISWSYLLNYDFGLVNYLLGLFGIDRIVWLSALPWARISLVIVEVWQHTPFFVIVLLAGLQAIPDEYSEAAHIDGGGPGQVFWHITLPLLRPALLVALVIRTTNAVRMFDHAYALTGGGPATSTETFSLLAYVEAFQLHNVPYAAAISWFIFVLNLAITLLFIRVLYVKVEV
jgi:multiple sugar transport system permease protein